jgi:hypothetical protein
MIELSKKLESDLKSYFMTKSIPKELLPWIEAKKKHRLSQKHIQMARELGLNPKGFGKLDNHKQEKWKAPLPEFIEELYYKRFNKETPDQVYSFEQLGVKFKDF